MDLKRRLWHVDTDTDSHANPDAGSNSNPNPDANPDANSCANTDPNSDADADSRLRDICCGHYLRVESSCQQRRRLLPMYGSWLVLIVRSVVLRAWHGFGLDFGMEQGDLGFLLGRYADPDANTNANTNTNADAYSDSNTYADPNPNPHANTSAGTKLCVQPIQGRDC